VRTPPICRGPVGLGANLTLVFLLFIPLQSFLQGGKNNLFFPLKGRFTGKAGAGAPDFKNYSCKAVLWNFPVPVPLLLALIRPCNPPTGEDCRDKSIVVRREE
jgi:hypothetical protein